MRVVIADDDVIVRAGVEGLLDTFEGVTVVAACGSLDELLEAVVEHQPDVVLTDIRMPPTKTIEGISAAQRLRETDPDIGVVVLSQFVDPSLAFAVLEAGSSGRGYVLKEHVANAEYLLEALRAVHRGGSFVDSEVLDALVAARTAGAGALLGRLTDRELEVLESMARGLSNASISDELVVGERAVEKHISSIFAKFDLKQEPSRHKRVCAVMVYLAESGQSTGRWTSLP